MIVVDVPHDCCVQARLLYFGSDDVKSMLEIGEALKQRARAYSLDYVMFIQIRIGFI